jgi:DNA-binding NarL/FixJ family response regulator
VQSAFAQPVLTYPTAAELEQQHLLTSAQLIIFSWGDGNTEASTNALKVLSELVPRIPVIVLGYNNDSELARSAMFHGAKGYIPVTMGFEIAIAAVHFVLAGGDLCAHGLPAPKRSARGRVVPATKNGPRHGP